MLTAAVAIAVLGAIATIAIAVACVATLKARAAQAALRATEEEHRACLERVRKMEGTFTIDPLSISVPTAALEPESASTSLTAAVVLVVEDEPRVRELIRMVLARAGHEVVAVEGPHVALAALQRHPATSLMLVDVVMPEMDGYDLVTEARKISPDVPVVFMSAFAPDATRHPSGDGFLAKPFTVESLTSAVDEALSRPRAAP